MNYQIFLLLALLICILIICFVLPKITSQYISIYTFFVSIICIIVMRTRKWGFLYKTDYILHIKE